MRPIKGTQEDLNARYWEHIVQDGVFVFTHPIGAVAKEFDLPPSSVHRYITPKEFSVTYACSRCPERHTATRDFMRRLELSQAASQYWTCSACCRKEFEEQAQREQRRIAESDRSRALLRERFAYKYVGDCPECANGILIYRRGNARGGLFIGCTNYPNCKCKRTIPEPIDLTPEELADLVGARKLVESAPKCPKCGNFLRAVAGKYGRFLGCAGYPQCRYIGDLTELTPAGYKTAKPVVDFDGLGL